MAGAGPEGFVSGTSMRIIPSCLDVSRSSPSPVRLICRSAREMLAPIVRSMSSCNDTFIAIAARVPHVQLDFFDWRHGLRDSVISLLHLGEIGRKQTSIRDIAEDELARGARRSGRDMRTRRLLPVPRRGHRSRRDR